MTSLQDDDRWLVRLFRDASDDLCVWANARYTQPERCWRWWAFRQVAKLLARLYALAHHNFRPFRPWSIVRYLYDWTVATLFLWRAHYQSLYWRAATEKARQDARERCHREG